MRRRSVFGLAGFLALTGAAAVLLGACGSGVSEEDYNAVKQQLSAKEQEAATAKQQVTSLQQQLKPAAPQEPKRLEEKITVVMNEGPDAMWFASADGVKGGPFTVSADKTVGIHIVNQSSKVLHEILFGRNPKMVSGQPEDYEVNLFEQVAADVFVYPAGGKIEIGGGEFGEIEVGPGDELWIRVKFPASLKGQWEIGCFVKEPDQKGHYEQGMKAALIIK